MIDRIINFIIFFPANLRFYIGEYEFFGFCLKPGDNFPWGNKRERNIFLNELADNEEEEELDRFLYWYKEWLLTCFHMRFTWAFVFHSLSYGCLFLSLVFVIAGSVPGMFAGALVVLVFLFAKYLCNKSISRLYFRLNMTKMAVDILKQDQELKECGGNDTVDFSDENRV